MVILGCCRVVVTGGAGGGEACAVGRGKTSFAVYYGAPSGARNHGASWVARPRSHANIGSPITDSLSIRSAAPECGLFDTRLIVAERECCSRECWCRPGQIVDRDHAAGSAA